RRQARRAEPRRPPPDEMPGPGNEAQQSAVGAEQQEVAVGHERLRGARPTRPANLPGREVEGVESLLAAADREVDERSAHDRPGVHDRRWERSRARAREAVRPERPGLLEARDVL